MFWPKKKMFEYDPALSAPNWSWFVLEGDVYAGLDELGNVLVHLSPDGHPAEAGVGNIALVIQVRD